MTVCGDGERPRIETSDHVPGRVRGDGSRGLSGCVLGIDVDPFIELRHRDPQLDRGEP